MESNWFENAWSTIVSWGSAVVSNEDLWSGFWPAIFGAAAGALFAFYLERAYRRRDRLSAECAKANRLISTLGRMLGVLENLQATLFSDLPVPAGEKPEPMGFGPVVGMPTQVPAVDLGEFDFLLETNDPHDRCATALGRTHFAQSKFDSAIVLFNARNDVAYRYRQSLGASMFLRGEEALGPNTEAAALRREMEYLTEQLAEALPSGVTLLKEVITQLRDALSQRYPGRQFIRLFPEDKEIAPL